MVGGQSLKLIFIRPSGFFLRLRKMVPRAKAISAISILAPGHASFRFLRELHAGRVVILKDCRPQTRL